MLDVKSVVFLIATFTSCFPTSAVAQDVFVNETLLQCIPNDVRGFTKLSGFVDVTYPSLIRQYNYTAYFLPVATGRYTFNVTEVIQKEPNQQFRLMYKSDIDGEKETQTNQIQTEQNLRNTTWKSVYLVSGRLYKLTFIRDKSWLLRSVKFQYLIPLLSISPWKEMRNQIIKFSGSRTNRSRALLGDWGAWSSCSGSCGNGTKVRQRLCPNGTLNLVGQMDLPQDSSESTTCHQNISCTGVAYFIVPKDTTCQDKCKQEGRICAKYGHDFPPTDAKDVFEALGITCNSTNNELSGELASPHYSNESAVVCMQFKMISEKQFVCTQKMENLICPCAPKPVPPIIGKIKRMFHPRRLNIRLGKPQTPRLKYYETFTVTAFTLNGTAVLSKTININYSSAVREDYQPLTNYCFKAYTTSKNGDGNYTASCFYFDTRDVPSQPPTNLTAHLVNATTLSASWNPINMSYPVMYGMTFKQYRLYAFQHGTNHYLHVTTPLKSPQSTSAVISNLLYYTTYCIRVSAFNVLGEGKLTDGCLVNVTTKGRGGGKECHNWRNITTWEEAPAWYPESLASQEINKTAVNMSWGAVPKLYQDVTILGYILCIWNENTSLCDDRFWFCNKTHSDVISVTIGVTYCLKVTAFNSVGLGPRSPCVNVTTRRAPTAPPSNVTAYNTSTTSIRIQWNEVPANHRHGSITEYHVVIHQSELNNTYTYNTSNQILDVNNLTVYTLYHITVKAINEEGPGISSPSISVWTEEGVPSMALSSFKAVGKGPTTMEFSWNSIPDSKIHGILKGYNFYMRPCGSSDESIWTYNSSSQIDAISYIGLTPMTCYNVSAAQFTSKGPGERSNWASGNTSESIPSESPENISAFNTSSTSINITWGQVPEGHRNGIVTGYKVVLVNGESNDTISTTVVDVATQHLEITNLQKYALYCVRVLAFTRVGNGTLSPCVMVFTDEDVPSSPPLSITYNVTSPSSIVVAWQPIPVNHSNGIITEYNIQHQNCDNPRSTRDVGVPQNVVMLSAVVPVKPYTCYQVRVCGVTVIGHGVYSVWYNIMTSQDKPGNAPQNITTKANSSTSISVTWDDVPPVDQNGIILGYKVQYTVDVNTVKAFNTTAKRYHFDNLKKFTEYCIQVLAYTIAGDGNWSSCVNQRTMADLPQEPPSSLTGQNLSSTAITLSWKKPTNKNGIIRGFVIYIYHYWYSGRMETTPVRIVLTCPDTSSKVFNDLYKGVKYCLIISAFTDAGQGKPSNCSHVTTNEEVPSAPPRNIEVVATSSTSLLVSWKNIFWKKRNGVLQGFTLVLRPTGLTTTATTTTTPTKAPTTATPAPDTTTPTSVAPAKLQLSRIRRDLDHYSPKATHLQLLINEKQSFDSVQQLETGDARKHRHRRSTNPDIVINIVDPGVRSHEVKNLEKGVEYCIIIYGRNAVGDGVKSSCTSQKTSSSDEIIPLVEAQASNTSIFVSLNITDFEKLRSTGYLKYYDLQFTVVRVSGNPVLDNDVIKRTVNATTQQFTVDNFDIYTTYALQLSLVTMSGSGSLTDPVYIETCHCPSKFYTNWFISPPFTNLKSGSQPGGILPIILGDIIDAACGRCEPGHGASSVEFFNDAKGEKTNLKANKSLVIGAINSNIDITFLINSKNQAKYIGTFIPVLNVPTLLLIKRNESSVDKFAKVVAGSILDIWPIIVVNLTFMLLAGAIIWTIERVSNNDQFPTKTAKGLFEGTWWSFVTMTTIGYGDRYPITVPGRIFAIIWALVGISMSSVMVGSICSTLTLTIVQEISSGVPSGIKIGAVSGTPDYEVATDVSSKAGAILLPFQNVGELVSALKTKEIDSIVLDHYTVQWKKNLFNGTWFKYSETVGSAFSYGVLLNGNAAKLERHFREYVSANITKIMELAGGLDKVDIADKNKTQDKEETSGRIVITKESLNFLSSESTIFIDTLMAMGVTLLAIYLAGLSYHFMIYRTRDRSNEIFKEKYRKHHEMIRSELQEFHSNFCLMHKYLRKEFVEALQMAKPKLQSMKPEQTMPIQYQRKFSQSGTEIEI